MAHWGIAMSLFHQIWERPNEQTVAHGWTEMQAARAHPAKSAREREYIAALSGFFELGQARAYQARIEDYAAAMGTLYSHYPNDVDAGAFYALSLLAAQAPDDTSLRLNLKAMAVLNPLLIQYPDHPGLVHYIIHACDTPSLAPDGLAAATHYGEIAPSGPHAVHMPGHIFARLGLWAADIQANRASVAASQSAEARGESSSAMDQFPLGRFPAVRLFAKRPGCGRESGHGGCISSAQSLRRYAQHGRSLHDGHVSVLSRQAAGYFQPRDAGLAGGLRTHPRRRRASPETQALTYWGRTIAAGVHLRQALARRGGPRRLRLC